ncbi:hypothetical protein Peur_014047 [Populus x canadensis]
MLGFNTKELAVAKIIGNNSRDKPCQQLERMRRWVLGDHLISQPSLLCISSTTKHLKETFKRFEPSIRPTEVDFLTTCSSCAVLVSATCR